MSFRLICGDVQTALPALALGSFDACFCDPPYHLTQASRGGSPRRNDLETPFGRTRLGSAGFMGKTWDGGDVALRAETWAEVYRVLKPGAFLMAFGGTRTWHRLACALEDAGFELRDTLTWLYGSGFPKSLDISKALDKAAGAEREVLARVRIKGGGTEHINRTNAATHTYRPGEYQKGENILDITAPATPEAARWSGYGTALKPAWEPVILAMKPCEGTYAENALKWGVAGLAIDAGRIPTEARLTGGSGVLWSHIRDGKQDKAEPRVNDGQGRWPANLLLDEEAAAMLDEQSGNRPSCNSPSTAKPVSIYRPSQGAYQPQGPIYPGDSGGASRFFYCAKSSRSEREAGLLGFLPCVKCGQLKSTTHRDDKGREVNCVRNDHPTVKPLKLLEYLAALILPPGRETPRRLLVPFAGSGSEIIGALQAGWDEAVGIDKSRQYLKIARHRLAAKALKAVA